MDRRLGFLFIALSALVFGSLGVTTKGVLNVATTNAFSITLLRALIALPILLAISAVTLGKNMLRIAFGDLRIMVLAGLMMALFQVAVTVQAVRARMGWREGTREDAGRSEGAGDSWSAATQACVT